MSRNFTDSEIGDMARGRGFGAMPAHEARRLLFTDAPPTVCTRQVRSGYYLYERTGRRVMLGMAVLR